MIWLIRIPFFINTEELASEERLDVSSQLLPCMKRKSSRPLCRLKLWLYVFLCGFKHEMNTETTQDDTTEVITLRDSERLLICSD